MTNSTDPASVTAIRDLAETFAIPIVVALVGLAGAVLGVLVSQWGAERQRRREAYAAAVRTLISWAEYPYRIRRRPDDDPATLANLTELGHTLQEDVRYHQTWIAAENRQVGALYREASTYVIAVGRQACRQAWQAPPAQTAAAMNLNGWGPPSVDDHIIALQSAISNRFGWRRAVNMNRWQKPAWPTSSVALVELTPRPADANDAELDERDVSSPAE
jgi:hypothetical protein